MKTNGSLNPFRPGRLAAAFLIGLAAGCGRSGGGGDGGLPVTFGSIDVGLDRAAIVDSMDIIDRTFADGHCAVVEGAVPAAGTRRLLRFDTVIINFGSVDIHVGDPANPIPPLQPSDFVYSPCHGHFHFGGWADYQLLDANQAVAAFGHKQAFCLEDSVPYGFNPSNDYECDDQGITSQWADIYAKNLDGQWVDITGVPEGDYTLVVTVNQEGKIPEVVDLQANSVSIPVHVPDPNLPP